MTKKSEKSFTLIEILIVISVVAVVAGFISLSVGGARAKGRDASRVSEVNTLRMALEYHYSDYREYPESTDWIKVEEDADTSGLFSQAMKFSYLPIIPRDPLYPKVEGEKVFSYQYKSTDEGRGYKIHVDLETGEGESYEVHSGDGNQIVYEGPLGGPPTPPTPPEGYAIKFDGIDDYIEVPDSNSLDITEEITIETWIKANSVTPRLDWSPVAVKKCDFTECYGMLVTVDQSEIYFFVQTSVSYAGAEMATGEWLHVVGSWDRVSPNNMDLYFNGVKLDEGPVSTSPISVSNLPLFIGGGTARSWEEGYSYCPYYFDGIIDEVRIYAKRLPESLITSHYQGDFSGDDTACDGDCDLRALWSFEEGFGITTVDGSGNGNDGALINDPEWVSVP